MNILVLVSTTIIIFSKTLFAMPIEYRHPKFANPDAISTNNFVSLKAGSFMMGTPATEAFRNTDEVRHKVNISRDFEMQSTVVTQGQFYNVMGFNPSTFSNKTNCTTDYIEVNGTSLCPNNPVENVSWHMADDYINQLNSIQQSHHYRLPTEAEWEYASRAGSQTTYWFGNNSQNVGDYVWYKANSKSQTQPVGLKPANPWGIYDAHGQVWQWTADWYGSYSTTEQTDPLGALPNFRRSTRGGSWDNDAQTVRAGFRGYIRPEYSFSVLGFRVVRTKK